MDEEAMEASKNEQQVLPLICDVLNTSSTGEGLTMMQLFRHAKKCVDCEPQSLKELLVDALKQGLNNGQLRQVGRGRVALATDTGGREDIVGLCGFCGGKVKRKRSCRRKKRSCRRKKKRSCRRKKRRSCRRKKKTCKPKKRRCPPKKRRCPPKKRRCPIKRCPGMLGEDSRLKGPPTGGQQPGGGQGEAQQGGNQPAQQPQRQRSSFIYRF